MIKISMLYPFHENAKFDINYYINTHAPMVRKLLGSALKGYEIEQGISGLEPDSKPVYITIAHLYVDSLDEFKTAYGHHIDLIQGDIPNYTDIQPIRQISRVGVRMSQRSIS